MHRFVRYGGLVAPTATLPWVGRLGVGIVALTIALTATAFATTSAYRAHRLRRAEQRAAMGEHTPLNQKPP